jgi:pimeloyl-ACP methyl ester carboxylesterase
LTDTLNVQGNLVVHLFGTLNRLQRLSKVVNTSLSSRLGSAPKSVLAQAESMQLARCSDVPYLFATQTAELTVRGAQGEIKKFRVAYTDEGSPYNDVLLFVHGLASYMPAWRKNIEVLRQDYRCISLDMVGYGKSDKRSTDGELPPYSMQLFSEIVVALMNHLLIRRATLCGHSMGGQISLTTALDYPHRVQRLVLIASAGFEKFSERDLSLMRRSATMESVRDASVSQIMANFRMNFYRQPNDADPMIADRIAMRGAADFDDYCRAVAGSIRAMIDGQLHDRYKHLEQETLIIYGENDGLIPNPLLHDGTPREVARYAASSIAKSHLVMVPQCGHFAQFERPEPINHVMKNFLQQQPIIVQG